MTRNSRSSRSRVSAGLLMFRRSDDEIEVLLAHPGGPFFVRKDEGVWTIPKGEAAPGEDLLTRAQIEFEEELGFHPENVPQWIELGWIQQKGGKIVHAWAFEGDLPEGFECKSNLFELEWPPRSGKYQNFPEVDRACFFSDKSARRKLKSRQVPFLDRLRVALADRDHERRFHNTSLAHSDGKILMQSPIKRWDLDNIKVARRVIVSVVAATVVLIGIALLVLPGPAFLVIPAGLAILATEYAWARRWLRKVRRIAKDVVSSTHRGEQEKHAPECAEHQAHKPK